MRSAPSGFVTRIVLAPALLVLLSLDHHLADYVADDEVDDPAHHHEPSENQRERRAKRARRFAEIRGFLRRTADACRGSYVSALTDAHLLARLCRRRLRSRYLAGGGPVAQRSEHPAHNRRDASSNLARAMFELLRGVHAVGAAAREAVAFSAASQRFGSANSLPNRTRSSWAPPRRNTCLRSPSPISACQTLSSLHCQPAASHPLQDPAAVIGDVLAGRDVLARSPTGSGKTLAFGIPMIDRTAAEARRPAALDARSDA